MESNEKRVSRLANGMLELAHSRRFARIRAWFDRTHRPTGEVERFELINGRALRADRRGGALHSL